MMQSVSKERFVPSGLTVFWGHAARLAVITGSWFIDRVALCPLLMRRLVGLLDITRQAAPLGFRMPFGGNSFFCDHALGRGSQAGRRRSRRRGCPLDALQARSGAPVGGAEPREVRGWKSDTGCIMIKPLLHKTGLMLAHPDEVLESVRNETPRATLTYLAIWTVALGILTALTNLLGFPCNLLHSGTNPQLFAYQVIAPLLEKATAVPAWIWMAPLIWVLMMVFVLLVSAFYHLIFKLLRGQGGYWQTVRFIVYPATPVLLFGWMPYLGGTVVAFWTAAMYPLALRRLHRFSWGLAVLFTGILMGIQIGRIFMTGEWYGVPVR